MIDRESLIRWLRGADEIFEALEGRGDAYNLCRRWVEEWFCRGGFCITDRDWEFLNEAFKSQLTESIEREVNRQIESDKKKAKRKGKQKEIEEIDWERIKEEVKNEMNRSSEDLLRELKSHTDKLAFAFCVYLISWNIRRFVAYFKQPYLKQSEESFDLITYFSTLNDKIYEVLNNLKKLRNLHIFRDEIDEKLVKDTFKELNDKLKKIGIQNNEPVSTAKILHIIAPYYISPIDNPIARNLREVELFKNEINQESFIEYMKWIKKKFSPFSEDIFLLEEERRKSFLKLLDQALYIRYSIDVVRRLK